MLSDGNEEIADWLERLTANKRDLGFGLRSLCLRNGQGHGCNHKRVYRVCCELELNLWIKPKKRLMRDKPEPLAFPVKWSGQFGQRAKMYPNRINGYENDESTEFSRQV